ncbi:hypothetical protein [Paracidovorax wautersii]|uniref:DUF3168 domain-containing protein n=1 Tax=Paracidovorax wautersii TaxID=1177982 RepID=A0A1I2GC85_9BURK|nr:hypothetical protein [Paracidovorax wautersii]SFF14808.1 hypothetical protein SAMN04489711_11463 [Paracidovorax wautersii]
MRDRAHTLPEGAPFAIGMAIVQALRNAQALQGAEVLDNPVRASDLTVGPRIVFFEDQHDKPRGDQPGQRQKRTYAFSLGVINRTEQARAGAHADYRAAKLAVRDSLAAINQRVRAEGSGLVEGEVRFRLENIDVGGGLVLGMFTFDYRDPD